MPSCWANGKMSEVLWQEASGLRRPACSAWPGKLNRIKPSATGLATAAAQLSGSLTKNPQDRCGKALEASKKMHPKSTSWEIRKEIEIPYNQKNQTTTLPQLVKGLYADKDIINQKCHKSKMNLIYLTYQRPELSLAT